MLYCKQNIPPFSRPLGQKVSLAMQNVLHLSMNDVAPFVRFVQRYEVPTSKKRGAPVLNAYDHRLFYVYSGTGEFRFPNRTHVVTRGDLLIWQAGVEYLKVHDNEHPLILLGCNFDLTRRHCHTVYPIPPETPDVFQPDLILEHVQLEGLPSLEEPIFLHDMTQLEPILLNMLEEFHNRKSYTDFRLSALMLDILCLAFRQLHTPVTSERKSTRHVDEIIEYLHQNFSAPITNETVGRHFNYHPNYLNKLMVQVTGKSLHQYLIDYRIMRAIDLLSTTDDSISAIALRVGFQDVCHFNRIFRQKTHHSPSEYRKRIF